MNILTIILISLGLSMDAFAVSVTGGANIKKSRFYNALKIGLLFGLFQAVMPLIGWIMGAGLKSYVSFFDHWIAFFLLLTIGVKMIYESVKSKKTAMDLLSTKVLFALAVATSIDALIVGFSFAFWVSSIIFSVIIIGLITFILCFTGFNMGNRISFILKNKVEVLGGLILIGIGLKILIEHLSS